MAKKSKQPQPVQIKHMKLDYELASSEHDVDAIRRIKAINKYLGSRENALVEKKMRGTPLASLLTGKTPAIGGEEFMAAQDIELAFMSISGAVMFKPLSLERVDKSNASRPLPVSTIKAIERYQAWADHWSARAKLHDPTMQIVIRAIVDMHPFSLIEQDLSLPWHGKAKQVTIRGLRDYAARAGWAGTNQHRWIVEAEKSFKAKDPNRIVHTALQQAQNAAQLIYDEISRNSSQKLFVSEEAFPSPDLREAS